MITTNTGAKKLESSDNWREIFPDNQGAQGAHNASVGAHDAAICQMCQTINGTTNNSGHTINSGEYFIANGGKYKATASIPVNEAWSGSAQAVSDNDLINALNNSIITLSNNLSTYEGTSLRDVHSNINIDNSYSTVYRVGNIVIMSVWFTVTATVPAWSILFRLSDASGFTPYGDFHIESKSVRYYLSSGPQYPGIGIREGISPGDYYLFAVYPSHI